MDTKDSEYLSRIIGNIQKAFNRKPEDSLFYELGQDLKKDREDQKLWWKKQSKIDAITRIQYYPHNLKAFLTKNSSAREEDFIKEEIDNIDYCLKHVFMGDSVQKQVFYHMTRYKEFLQETLENIIAEKQSKTDEIKKDTHIPFLINRTQVVALMVLFMDSGIIQPLSDYRLAKLIENLFFYEIDKPMRSIAIEISKFRNLEKDPEKAKIFWENIFKTAKIKTKDEM